MSEQYEFIGRVREMEEIDQFIHSPEKSVFLLIGKAGMGKSALVRQLDRLLQQDKTILFSHLFDIDRDQSPENLASEMNDALTKGRFLFWVPDDRRKLKTVAAAIPTIGPIIQALIKDDTKSQRSKLVDILKIVGKGTQQRIVLIADPFDYMEKREYEDFFTALARHLPATVKLIVPQRPADVLASSSRFLALPTVIRNQTELGYLPKGDAYRMTRSLIDSPKETKDIFDMLWEQSQGWPLALYVGASGYARTKNAALPLLPDIESLFEHLLESALDNTRQVVYAASLSPLSLYLDDLRAISGLSISEFAMTMDNPTTKQVLVTQNRDGNTYGRLFHVLFRDFVRVHLKQLGISYEPFLERLHHSLLEQAKSLYNRMETMTVTERDASALRFARKLSLYQSLLAANEEICQLIQILFARIESLRYGGRSYSLYSLLILAQANAICIKPGDEERFARILQTAMIEDTFLHPEYALILLGSFILASKANLHPEAVHILKGRISRLAKQDTRKLLAEVASRIEYSLEKGADPLVAFKLDELLPDVYSQQASLDDEELDSPYAKIRIDKLIQIPDSELKPEDRDFIYRYIRHTRQK